jgi:hypothetical protein
MWCKSAARRQTVVFQRLVQRHFHFSPQIFRGLWAVLKLSGFLGPTDKLMNKKLTPFQITNRSDRRLPLSPSIQPIYHH